MNVKKNLKIGLKPNHHYIKFKEFMSIEKEYHNKDIDIDEAIDDFFND